MTSLDKRLHAYRSDLADARLRDHVKAERFVEGLPARIGVPVADLLAQPHRDGPINSQLLLGDGVMVFDDADGLSWVQAVRDGYVGYIETSALSAVVGKPTHGVTALRTFVYPGADMKLPRVAALSLGSSVVVVGETETRGTRYAVLDDGTAIVAAHIAALGRMVNDYVAIAESLVGTPYLWGGASAFGIDCSGLVQLAMRMAGRAAPRDSDMQAANLGDPLGVDGARPTLRRGDLVFWKGHVAIMTDETSLVHANGHTMTVAREGVAEAIARIGYLYGGPTGYRRP